MLRYFSRFERVLQVRSRLHPGQRARKEGRSFMKYAIIETGGKQYRVTAGDVIFVEKLDAEAGATVTFDKVLAVTGEGENTFGAPYIEGRTVTGTVVKQGKSKKIRVYHMKPKKGYRKTQGHRQPYTKVEIGSIG